jgi:DNA repair ATPase RecN
LASGFRRLGRPLRKLEAMAGRGEFPVAPEVREKLSEYLKRPFAAFIREEEGYPSLKSILRNLEQAVERKKLLLKQREERKVLERIESVAERNMLDRIHRDAKTLVAERRKYLHDPECLELVRAYRQKKQDLKNLQSKYTELKHRSNLISERVQALKNSLTQYARETELLAEKLAKRTVRIELDL